MTEQKKTGRRLAVEALMRQEQAGYSNLVLDAALKHSGLEGREKAFAGAVFYGTIERMYTLDWMLGRCMRQPLQKLDAPVRAVLRAGLYQAVYMDSVPVSAAVNESVQLTRVLRKASAAGFVNAVLRKATQQKPEAAQFENEAQRLSVLCAVSLPIAEKFCEWYGSEAEKVLNSFFVRAPLALRANTMKNTPQRLCEALRAEGWAAEEGPVPGSVLAEGKGSIAATRAFAEGGLHVQGLASQLACLCLDARPGQKVIDTCAAPGGKTATLAQYMQNEGTLLCGDAAAARVPLITAAAERLGLDCIGARCHDAAQYEPEWANADRVLCDVPCSGLGILAKKPDIRCKDLAGLAELYPLQAQILETSARYVKAGGKLVYSTCTLNPDENERQVQKFLARHSEFAPAAPAFYLPGADVDGCMMTLRPDKTGTDGFFVAVLERTGA